MGGEKNDPHLHLQLKDFLTFPWSVLFRRLGSGPEHLSASHLVPTHVKAGMPKPALRAAAGGGPEFNLHLPSSSTPCLSPSSSTLFCLSCYILTQKLIPLYSPFHCNSFLCAPSEMLRNVNKEGEEHTNREEYGNDKFE